MTFSTEPFLTPRGEIAPKVNGVMISREGKVIGHIDLNGQKMASMVLENGYRVTVFETGRILAEPPMFKVIRRRGFMDTTCVPAPVPSEMMA